MGSWSGKIPNSGLEIRHSRSMSDEPAQLREQWGQVIESTRSLVTTTVQVWGFLTAANAALLGFGLSRESRQWALYAAPLLVLMMIAIGLLATYVATPIIYTGLVTEKRLTVRAPLITTFTNAKAKAFVEAVESVDPKYEGNKAAELPRRVVMTRRPILALLLVYAIAQLALAVLVNVL